MPKIISEEILLKYEGQFPRYTSYPTAPHFKEDVNGKIYENWLKSLPPKQNLSLYFHIPFCHELCWYCGCYTKITKRYAPVEDYVHILFREIKLVSNLIKSGNHKVLHIHFGGGSPNILLPETFLQLAKLIHQEFTIDKNAEIAIEIDPRTTVNEEKIIAYQKAGINRISIGIQDFNIHVQKAINREQSFDVVYDCIKLFRKHEINKINLDLIYGLPKQTVEDVRKTIDYSMLLKPDRFAVFAYAHVNWKKKHMRLINEEDLPNSAERIKMQKVAMQKMLEEGYKAIGLDHFAKENDEMNIALKSKKLKRNFQGYSTDKADYIIGFGASSISYLPLGYAQNTLDFAEYEKSILSSKLPVKKGIVINKEDKMRKKIIDELMCYMEVDLKAVCAEFDFDVDFFNDELKELLKFAEDNLLIIENYFVKLNKSAPQIARVVSSVFDKFFQASTTKHSKIT